MSRLRLLLVDDHVLVAEMLRERLAREERFEIVGVARHGEEAVLLALSHRPDIVLMDVDLPGLPSFEAARRILDAAPLTKLIMLSAHIRDQYIDRAIRLGAMGYVVKNDPTAALISAIDEVAQGRTSFSASVQARLVFDEDGPHLGASAAGRSRADTLTPREVEVLKYIADGMAKKEIAEMLHLSLKTVEKHADNLMAKLDIHDRVTLTRFAIREGLIHA